MASESTILPLLYKYYQNSELSPAELATLQSWLAASEKNQELFDELSNSARWSKAAEEFRGTNTDPAYVLLQQRMQAPAKVVRSRFAWWQAAALVGGLVLLSGTWWWSKHLTTATPPARLVQAPIIPGHSDSLVVVETSSGSAIVLGKADQTIRDNGAVVAKAEADELNYSSTANITPGLFNTIRIPVGKQYHLVLEDGTRVWMNAVSQLRYPVQFTGATREVELSGAGYFEVKSDAQHPFIVHTSRGTITVTGTHFVVTDYPTDPAMITGLEEGKVQVKTSTTSRNVRPGEVVEVSHNQQVNLSSTPLTQVMAWKEHKLWFRNASYEEIFTTLVRWYAIDVKFERTISSRFSGVLPTNRPLQELLTILEKAGGVHFHLEGRQLTITE